MIHSFLVFFFVCNYAENSRRKSTPAAGHLTPQYGHIDMLWTNAGRAGDKAEPPATPVPFKFGHLTAVELHELDATPTREPPEFGISLCQTTTAAEGRPTVPLEHAMLAGAMVGLWDQGAESRYHGRPPPRHGEPDSSEVDQIPASQGHYV